MPDPAGERPSPLTFGQLSVLRALQELPVERWHETYLTSVIALPVGTDLPAVRDALWTVQARHESLRTLYVAGPDDVAPPEKLAVTLPSAEPVVEVVDAPGVDGEQALATALARLSGRFDWEVETAWRSVVTVDHDRLTYLVVIVDHITADAFGLQRLAAELRALLRGDDEAGARWLAEVPPQPRVLAEAQRSDSWHARRAGANRYWDGLLRDLSPEVFPGPAGAHDAGRIEGVLHSPRARAALARAAHRIGISPQSVMLALAGLALASAYGQDDVVLTLQASNRYDLRWRHVVSSMNQAAPLHVALGSATSTFDEFARLLHWRGLNAYRHASYHFDDMVHKVRRARGVDLRLDTVFNFLARSLVPVGGPVPDQLPEPWIEETRPRRQVGPRFDVKIRDADDMPVLIRADPTLLSQDRLNHLLFWFDDELSRLAAEEGVRIVDVRRRCDGLSARTH